MSPGASRGELAAGCSTEPPATRGATDRSSWVRSTRKAALAAAASVEQRLGLVGGLARGLARRRLGRLGCLGRLARGLLREPPCGGRPYETRGGGGGGRGG